MNRMTGRPHKHSGYYSDLLLEVLDSPNKQYIPWIVDKILQNAEESLLTAELQYDDYLASIATIAKARMSIAFAA